MVEALRAPSHRPTGLEPRVAGGGFRAGREVPCSRPGLGPSWICLQTRVGAELKSPTPLLFACVCVKSLQSGPTLPGSSVHGDSPGKNTGVGCHALLQGIFLTQGSHLYHFEFSSIAQLCPALCDPMDCSMPGFPVDCQLPEFIQAHVHQIGDAIQPSHPLSSPSPTTFNPFQHQGLFK